MVGAAIMLAAALIPPPSDLTVIVPDEPPLFAQAMPFTRRLPRIPGSGGVTTFIVETFDTASGYDNTWTESYDPAFDPDESTTVKEGTESLYCTTTANRWTRTEFSAKSSIYGKVWFRITSTQSGNPRFEFRTSGDTLLAEVRFVDGTDVLRAFAGSNNSSGPTSLSADTWYRIWFEWQESSGSDGQMRVWLNTTDSKPGSVEVERTDGNVTGQCSRFYIFGANAVNWYVDDLQMSTDPAFE